MADVRITSGSQALAPLQPVGRADAVKAAQRAFFNAALTQAEVQAQSEAKRVQAATQAETEPVTTRLNATVDHASAQPERILRPGSLLDIKV